MSRSSNLRTAYCFSGHLRTFDTAFPAFYGNVMQHLPGDVFIHTWNTVGAPGRTHWSGDPEDSVRRTLSSQMLSKAMELYRPTSFLLEEQDLYLPLTVNDRRYDATSNISTRTVFFMWLSLYKANELRKQHEQTTGKHYDKVFRVRPDWVIREPLPPEELADCSALYVAQSDDHFRVNRVPDCFFHGPPELVDCAAALFKDIEERLFKRGGAPEDGLSEYLMDLQVPLKVSKADWSFARLDGTYSYRPTGEYMDLPELFKKG